MEQLYNTNKFIIVWAVNYGLFFSLALLNLEF